MAALQQATQQSDIKRTTELVKLVVDFSRGYQAKA